MNLDQLNIGDYAKVLEIKGHNKDRQHLLDMGLIPGVELKVIKRAPMGDPLEIRLHGYELALRESYAKKLKVEKTQKVLTHKFRDDKFCADYEKLDSQKSTLNPNELYNLSKLHNCELCHKNCKHNPNLVKKEKISSVHTKKNLKDELLNETEHPGFGESGKYHHKSNEHPLPEGKTINFALVGNQNCGKTTLFNTLTGSNQHVGNFPGVTIDKKDGQIKGHPNTNITDLPGIYSLSPYSKEEIVTRDFILKDDVDCIINIVDATSLERSLYLTMQLLQLEHPMVLALNMMDEVLKNDGSILVNKLEQALGIPVVPISAMKNEGIEELVDHALHVAKYQELPLIQDFCAPDDRGGSVHRALHSIMHIVEDHCSRLKDNKLLSKFSDNEDSDKSNKRKDWISKNFVPISHMHIIPIRFAAEKIAENDQSVFDELNLENHDKGAIEHILTRMEEECKLDRVACIADMRYRFILNVCKLCVIKGKPSVQRKRSEKADQILTGKYTGIPAFILIMMLVFFLTFKVFGSFLQNLISDGLDSLSSFCISLMTNTGINVVAQSFVKDALFTGVGSVLSFLPIIVILFFFLSILEDSGYMARVAFVMDKLLRKIGLSGRSIVPMLIGFGCSVPAIMATRTLPSERDRRLTILLIPFMSCSAKLPIYVFISSIFFPNYAALVMALMYFGGILIGIVVSLLFKGKSKPVPFIMELPNYRMPSIKNVFHLLWDKTKDFLQKAFTVILIATIVIWFLQSFDLSLNYTTNTSSSMLAIFAGFISPVFAPIGLGDWRIITSLISGLMAKESVVAVMAMLYSDAGAIISSISWIVAISFLVFSLLYSPCVAAINAARQEMGIRWALFIVFFQCLLAWIFSFAIFNILILFT